MHTKSQPRLETAGDLIPSEIHPCKIHASVAFGFPQASLGTLWGQHVIPGGPQFVPRLPNDRGVISQGSLNNAPGIPYISAGCDPGCASRPQGHLQPQLDCPLSIHPYIYIYTLAPPLETRERGRRPGWPVCPLMITCKNAYDVPTTP